MKLETLSITSIYELLNQLRLTDDQVRQFNMLLKFFLEEEERFLLSLESYESQQDGEAYMVNAREEREINHVLSWVK